MSFYKPPFSIILKLEEICFVNLIYFEILASISAHQSFSGPFEAFGGIGLSTNICRFCVQVMSHEMEMENKFELQMACFEGQNI